MISSRFSEALNKNSDSSRLPDGIIVFSHLRWNFVWQRPQQFLSRFAKRHKILFVEEAVFDSETPRLELYSPMANVTVACPHLPVPISSDTGHIVRKLVLDAIKDFDRDGSFESPLLWYYCPMQAAWSMDYFNGRGIVYDCMDELSQFAGAPTELVANEIRLLRRADIVFTGGYELFKKKAKQHGNVHVFGCGVDYAHFAKAQDVNTPVPEDIAELPSPAIGWFGVVDERMDYDLLAKVAAQRPDWSFAIVGPVVKVDQAVLPKNANIYWLGQKDYKELPNYCRGFDVCMMPFALNEATEYINPTKALEYFATGLPVVSTPVRDVVRQYGDIAYIANTPQKFIKAIEGTLQNRDEERIRRGIQLARSKSWETTVSKMQNLIANAIGTGAQPIQTRPQASKLSTRSQPAQGS